MQVCKHQLNLNEERIMTLTTLTKNSWKQTFMSDFAPVIEKANRNYNIVDVDLNTFTLKLL